MVVLNVILSLLFLPHFCRTDAQIPFLPHAALASHLPWWSQSGAGAFLLSLQASAYRRVHPGKWVVHTAASKVSDRQWITCSGAHGSRHALRGYYLTAIERYVPRQPDWSNDITPSVLILFVIFQTVISTVNHMALFITPLAIIVTADLTEILVYGYNTFLWLPLHDRLIWQMTRAYPYQFPANRDRR